MYSTLVKIFRSASAPPDTRIYAVGDIHGYNDALERLLEKIKLHIKKNPVANPIIVFLGDYSSRGPNSNLVMGRLAGEREKQSVDGIKRIFLLGDHDHAFKAFLNTVKPASIGDDLAFFLDNGGIGTLRSFGISIKGSERKIINDRSRIIPRSGIIVDVDTIHEAQQKLRLALPQPIKDLYDAAQVCFEAGDYFFAHAAVDPDREINAFDQHASMLMGTDPLSKKFPSCRRSLDKVVVHGHTIRKPYVHGNQVGVDSGIYQTGLLTCAVLEGKKVSFLQANTDLPLFGAKPKRIAHPT